MRLRAGVTSLPITSGCAFSPQLSAPFWFPDSVLLCALLCTRRLVVVAAAAGRAADSAAVDVPPAHRAWFLLAVYLNDCAKAVLSRLAAAALSVGSDSSHLDARPRLFLRRSQWRSCRCSVPSVVRPRAARLGIRSGPACEQWFLGDAMASLIVTPILFYWMLRPPNPATFSTAAGHRGRRARHRIADHACRWRSKQKCGPTRLRRNALLRAGAFHGVGGDPFSHVRRDRGGCAAVDLRRRRRHRCAPGHSPDLSIAETSSRLQHFLLLRAAPLYLAAVLIEQWSPRQRFVARERRAVSHHCGPGADDDVDLGCRGGLRIRQPALAGLHRHDARTEPGRGLGQVPASRRYTEDLSISTCPIFTRAYPWRWSTARGVTMASIDGFRCMECRASAPTANSPVYIGSATDITERRQQEAALKRSEARYRDVVESQIAFVCRFLPDATLTFVNSAYCRFLGKPRARVVRRKFPRAAAASARVRRRAKRSSGPCRVPITQRGNARWSKPTVRAAGRAGCATCHRSRVGRSARNPGHRSRHHRSQARGGIRSAAGAGGALRGGR